MRSALRPTRGGTLLLRMVRCMQRRRRAGGAWSRCRCGSREPGPDAEEAGVSPVPVQMWPARLVQGKNCVADDLWVSVVEHREPAQPAAVPGGR